VAAWSGRDILLPSVWQSRKVGTAVPQERESLTHHRWRPPQGNSFPAPNLHPCYHHPTKVKAGTVLPHWTLSFTVTAPPPAAEMIPYIYYAPAVDFCIVA
jgi:hypothetical protein